MAAQPYVLARTMKDAHNFARDELGLVYGNYRVVNSPSTIKSVRGADLFLVPGYQNRFDRFAMKGAIRWTRMNVRDVAAEAAAEATPADLFANQDEIRQAAEAEIAAHIVTAGKIAAHTVTAGKIPDGLEPAGVQPTLDFTTFFDTSDGDAMVAEGGPVVAEVETDAPKRRRRRCKECGSLHFKGDACSDTEG